MKIQTAILLSVLLTTKCFGQNEMPTKEDKVLYEIIDSSITSSGTDLHNRSKIWFANAFRNSKEVIRVDDKENGVLIGKGNFSFEQSLVPFIVRFSIKVNSKDNKYRIQFYEITYQEGTGGREKNAETLNEKKGRDKLKENINSKFADLILDFQTAMKNKIDNDF